MSYIILSTDWSLYENRLSACVQCKTAFEYKDNFPNAYNISLENGELYQFYSKKGNKRKDGFWSKYENRLAAAKLCQYRSEYSKRFGQAYEISSNNDELDKFIWFKNSEHSFDSERKIHLIYVYIDEENKYFYVGRTTDYNLKTRHSHHKSASKHDTVFKYWNSIGKPVPEPIIVEDKLTLNESKIKEHEYEELYISYGYTKLNIMPTGEKSSSIGGILKKWNKDTCYDAAKLCSSRSEYSSRFQGAYQMSRIYGWLDDYTWFRSQITFEEAYQAACQCETVKEFKTKYLKYYEFFKRNKITQLLPLKGIRIVMTEELCRKQASQCKSRTEFKIKYQYAWKYAHKHNLIDELFPKHYKNVSIKVERTIENCYKYAKLCISRNEFHNTYTGLYNLAREFNLLDELFPKEVMTDEQCIKFAKNVKQRSEFKKLYHKWYKYAQKHNLLDLLFPKNK